MEKCIEEKIGPHPPSKAPIRVSYFNREDGSMSRTFKHWGEGICFQSDTPFEVGATVLIRACGFEDGCGCNAPQPPTNILGAVKWCKEIPGAVPSGYEVSVRYFHSEF